ncbi:MAG: hypothetical protein ACKO4U_11445, partial [Caldilinea sp.]
MRRQTIFLVVLFLGFLALWGQTGVAWARSVPASPAASHPPELLQTGATAAGQATLTLTRPLAQVAVGYYHTCALTSAGSVRCWGYNGYGQLGD